ncbi:MAG TPA: PD-(D/E)XK nuclease family protein, partial [Polyangiaceae bacterium]|nr:PD-(D/E)XK nuclease family protein [Polyangiaceae bacterium]
ATKIVLRSPSASLRLERAAQFLVSCGATTELLILGASVDAAAGLARVAAGDSTSTFGWHRFTLARLGAVLAAHTLGDRGLTPVGALPLEAVCARLVHRLGAAGLGRFAAIFDRPGLPRALSRTLDELRMAGVRPGELDDADVAAILVAYEAELARANLVDRAEVLRLASVAVAGGQRDDPVGRPIVFIDVPVQSGREADLVAKLCERASRCFLTVPLGDDRTYDFVKTLPGLETVDEQRTDGTALSRLQAGLFSPTAALGQSGDDVVILSAPGESRECVEIARRLHEEAERGTPFDRMAIVLRSTQQYRAHLEEALRRASIPAHFARGTVRPDPAGRAFIALLACAADGLSARRFAEYLSLGEVADAETQGRPPRAAPATERWFPPDEELLPEAIARASDAPADDDVDTIDALAPATVAAGGLVASSAPLSTTDEKKATVFGTLRAPRLWERLLVDAAVIGGLDRWDRRLAGLRREFELDQHELRDPDHPMAARLERDIEAIDSLRAYALPLLADLEALAALVADWGTWLDRLSALATRALRRPERVLAVLAELAPMSEVTPVDLTEVRLVLERRLTDLVLRPSERPYGRVYLAPVDQVRGLCFDVVFVPGLAERLFPQKVTEDPILPDRERSKLAGRLRTNADRSATERLLLRIAVGAAQKRLVLCYPRIDVEQSRPRTPSFYGLEVLRAAEGRLPGFDELARRAEEVGEARLGWPAPLRPAQAIDAAEHDLALLQSILDRSESETVGRARYLLDANPHLKRALRFRARRWIKNFTRADGLVDPDPLAKAALAAHGLGARSFSPTALQHYAACPYKFVLSALHKLAPREEPVPLEELDPLQRGSLIHEVEFALQGKLRDAGLLPVTEGTLGPARAVLDEVLDAVAEKYRDLLAPAIERVWEDGIASIRADLREMLRRATEETTWIPAHFELSFGLTERRERDPRSIDEPAVLDCGIRLRGSIDLVERREGGGLRATDYKTGKARAVDGTIIGGGETLQPVLYALTLEKLFPEQRIDSGRLYYCTSIGEFKEVVMPLDDEARRAAAEVAKTVGEALEKGFLPAAPAPRGCEWCDYRPVCGPYEELRTSRIKRQDKLVALHALRKRV